MADKRARKEAEDVEELEGGLDEELQKKLDEFNDVQLELEKVNDEASERVLQVEQEFNQKRKPIYVKRAAVIKELPNFWAQTLSNHPDLRGTLTDDDISALESCTELTVEDHDDIKSGYKVILKFDGNPYFENAVLSKDYKFDENDTITVASTAIKWKAGMEPRDDDEEAAVPAKRKQSGKEYGFLKWFVDETLKAGEHDPLAELIKEDIWPNPMKFFLGVPEDLDEELDLVSDDEGEDGEGEEGEEEDLDEGEDDA